MRIARSLLLVAGIVCAAGPVLAAETASAVERGFRDGRFVDEYFGVVYAADGLEEAATLSSLFSGKLPGGGEVEVVLQESQQPMDALDWRTLAKQRWQSDGGTRTDMAEGMSPHPWVRFVQTSPAALAGRHAYAFYTRGHQLFMVHAWAPGTTDAVAAELDRAVAGLELKKTSSDSFLMAHLVAREAKLDPRSAKVLAQAATIYMRDGRFKNPDLASRAAEDALAQAQASGLDADETLRIAFTTGTIQLATGRGEQAIPTWEKALELAEQLPNAAEEGALIHYNLACTYARLDRKDQAFRELEKSLEMADESTDNRLRDNARGDPDLETLRADPRWKKLF